MAAWSDGYVTDMQYTGRCYPELAPGYLAFACLRQGVRPPDLDAGAAYLELGCGQGFGLNLLAAANPHLRFHGVDFHPAQIANARRLADEAGLDNVSFDDLSFEALLDLPEARLGKFDIVVMHGVLSWVSDRNRAAIVRLLDRAVKPGGLVYVSYNAMPGWAALVPLRRFVAEYVARAKGDPTKEVVEALKAALALADAKIGAFAATPAMRDHIAEAIGQPPAYLVHEYLNAHSRPLFHADLAAEFGEARLWFAASANPADDLVHLAAPPALRPQIVAADPVWRETLLDYAATKIFRRDIFVRGRNDLSLRERDHLLGATGFALLGDPADAAFEFPIPLGRLTGAANVYGPIIRALAEGPKTYAELAAGAEAVGAAPGAAFQALVLLTGARRIHPLAPGQDFAPARAINRALFARMAFDETPPNVAAPAAGTAVRVEFADLVALKAAVEGRSPEEAARDAWPGMARTGRRLMRNGAPLTDQADNEAELAARITAFNRDRRHLFERLGAI